MLRLLLILSFAYWLSNCRALDLQCSINVDNWGHLVFGNACEVAGAVITAPNETVNTINNQTSSYYDGRNFIIFTINRQTVNYMPKGIGKFFPGISGLSIIQSKLKVIDKDDLQPFDRLVVLYLNGNELETLSGDLFDHNPLLRDLFVNGNKLKSIGSKIFTKLTLLEYADFDDNICINDRAPSQLWIPAFIEKLRQQCPDSVGAPNLSSGQ